MTIKMLLKESHRIAKEKGWWDEKRTMGEILCLVHSEVSEALEEYRNGVNLREITLADGGKPVGFPVEIADIMIRLGDLCEAQGIDLVKAIDAKMAYNKTRPYRHGGKVA